MHQTVAGGIERGDLRFGKIVGEIDDPRAAGLGLQGANERPGVLVGIEAVRAEVFDDERDGIAAGESAVVGVEQHVDAFAGNRAADEEELVRIGGDAPRGGVRAEIERLDARMEAQRLTPFGTTTTFSAATPLAR